MAKTLQLNFNTASGKKVTLTVDEPRADLTSQNVVAAMQEIITSDVFEIDGVALTSVAGARIVERTITELVNA
ncbi:DUF2922 domain-containing protein [Sporosarcina sp. FA9]|uniref:DUF2922 domain-containing protein n=1 Tax=Sporosarcina sp. FA9 TaxID=3413030 RepID=UPI003F65B052